MVTFLAVVGGVVGIVAFVGGAIVIWLYSISAQGKNPFE